MYEAATLLSLAEAVLSWEGVPFRLEAAIGLAIGLPPELDSLPYLSSVDAALTVVPPEHTVHLSDWEYESLRAKGPWMAIVLPRNTRGRGSDFSFVNRCQHAPTPAKALLCASLRARAYQLIPPPSSKETAQ